MSDNTFTRVDPLMVHDALLYGPHRQDAADYACAALRAAYEEMDNNDEAIQSYARTVVRMQAEIDRLRANALEWVTVTEDPASMPTLGTRVLVCPHGTSEAPRIMWRYTYHMWTSARDYSNWVQITPGDRWAYIPEVKE